jgi:hypothetical protein
MMTLYSRRPASIHAACFILVAALFVSSASAFAATVVSSFRSKGNFASVGVEYDSCTWMSLWVARSDSSTAPTTYLSYYIYNGCTGESSWGDGHIRNSDFTVSGKKSRLNTDPAASPNMVTNGQVGRITLTWTADTSIRSSWDGRSESITPTQRVRSRGRSESSAASLVGTMFGVSVRSETASVGKNRDMFTEVLR